MDPKKLLASRVAQHRRVKFHGTPGDPDYPHEGGGGGSGEGESVRGSSGGEMISGWDDEHGKDVTREARDRKGRGLGKGDRVSYDDPNTGKSGEGKIKSLQIKSGGIALNVDSLPDSWVYADEVQKL